SLLLKPLVPHVVPEVRLWQGLQHAYGTSPDERYAALLVDIRGGVTSSSRAALDDDGPSIEGVSDFPDPGALRWDLVEALAHLAAHTSRDDIVRVATSYARKFMPFSAMIGVRFFDDESGKKKIATCVGWLRSGPAEGVQFLNKPFVVTEDCVLDGALANPSPSLGKPAITPGNAALFGWLGRRRPRTFLVLPVVVTGRTVGALVADGGIRARDFASMSDLVAFGARLGPAFEALLRARRASAPPEPSPQEHAHHVDAPVPQRTPLPRTDTPLMTSEPPQAARQPVPSPAERAQTASAMFDIHKEVTAPMLHLQPVDAAVDRVDDDVPAPPPLPAPRPGEPRPITMTAMPAVRLAPPTLSSIASVASSAPVAPALVRVDDGRDGTSPFARNYVSQHGPPPPPPPRSPTPLPRLPMVVENLADLALLDAGTAAFADVSDAHANDAWRGALEDAVERGHQGGSASAEDRAQLFLDEEGWEDIRYDGYDAVAVAVAVQGGGDRGALSMPLLDQTVGDGEPVTEEEPLTSSEQRLEELVDQLDALDDGTVDRARQKVLARGVDAMPALEQHFPGRLRVDPFDPGENVRDAAKLGPLVEVLYALGPAGLDAAVPHLDSRYPAHRFAAVLLFALTPDERGIELLRARLHDQEPRIRQLAADALAPFVAHKQFETVLAHLRDRLKSPLLDARRRAVQLLGAFRDVGSVPLLMALLESKGGAELAEDARQALRMITLQDFGVRARGWDKWWQKAKKRSRVDWLIEGLSSEDRELRTVSH
ncbi:MAG TPA: HEAT repeat domain-containing protein, partial [Myxococcota bacterium]